MNYVLQIALFICSFSLSLGIPTYVFAQSSKNFTSIFGIDLSNQKAVVFEKNLKARGTILVFLSSRCPCSASHEPLLKDLAKKYSNFNFIGVHSNGDETVAEAAEHFKKADLGFPVLNDPSSKTADLYGALKTPHAYVFNSAGDLVYDGGVTSSSVGPSADKQYLREVLEDLDSNKKPRFNKQRSLGCYIQRQEPL